MGKTQPTMAGFEGGGRKTLAEGCRKPLESGKDKRMDSSLEPPERTWLC